MDIPVSNYSISENVAARCVEPHNSAGNVCAVKLIHSGGGFNLLVAMALTTEITSPADQDHLDNLPAQIEHIIRGSSVQSIPSIIQEVIEKTDLSKINKGTHKYNGILTFIHAGRVYLAQIGKGRAFLVRNGSVTQITYDHNLASELLSLQKTLSPNVRNLNWGRQSGPDAWNDDHPAIDMRIKLPYGSHTYLDLGPDDRVVLMSEKPGYHIQNTEEKIQKYLFMEKNTTSNDTGDQDNITDTEAQGLSDVPIVIIDPIPNAPSDKPVHQKMNGLQWLGVLALLLVISIGIGLLAAYEIPLVMNPKPLPDTVPAMEQPGFLSVAAEDGFAQAVYAGKQTQNLAPGTLIDAEPGMRVQTNIGTVKLQLSDGTQIYIGNDSSVTLQRIADPKLRQIYSTLELVKGQILVDISHGSGGVATVLAGSQNQIAVTGEFMGVSYQLGSDQVDVDCLQGGCRLADGKAVRDLLSGQHASSLAGQVSDADLARWTMWDFLCDNDCPSQSNQASQILSQP